MEWTLKRNCCLTPRQLGSAYALLVGFSCVAAGVFLIHGLWHVLAFAILEMAGVGVAFLNYGLHATDQEHITLIGDCLLVEREQAGKRQQIRLDPHFTRVDVPRCPRDLIRLEARGVQVTVGRYVTQNRRRQVGCELRRALRNTSLALQAR
jgi:uncharacterized membrane protein